MRRLFIGSLAAPTTKDRAIHLVKSEYANHSIRRAVEEERLVPDDADLMYEFITEVQASQGITESRKNKIVYLLVSWRRYMPPYRDFTIAQISKAISTIKTATNQRGRPFKQNTIHDHIILLKRFLLWMIENGYPDLPEQKIRKIKPPAVDTKTKSTDKLLSPDEVEALLRACQTSRDRALIAVLYESGCRIGELARLTWSQVRFDAYGAVVTVDDTKCHTQRYVRLVMARSYLATWRNDYPFDPEGDALVFVTHQRNPLNHGMVSSQLNRLARRAGIAKKVHAHIFRHSRITHLINQGMNESVIKMMMWGNLSTNMFATYAHICGNDIDREVPGQYGIVRKEAKETTALEPVQCSSCLTVNAPGARYCTVCGQGLCDGGTVTQEQMSTDVLSNPELLKRLLNDLIEEKKRKGEL